MCAVNIVRLEKFPSGSSALTWSRPILRLLFACAILFEKAFPSNTSQRAGTLQRAPLSVLGLAKCWLPYRLNLSVSEPGTAIDGYDDRDSSLSISQVPEIGLSGRTS